MNVCIRVGDYYIPSLVYLALTFGSDPDLLILSSVENGLEEVCEGLGVGGVVMAVAFFPY